MLGQLTDFLKGKPAKRRSPLWPRVRAEHLAANPACAACGKTKGLEVHHKKPFQLFPDLELARDNLITLCEPQNCHYLFGHGLDWKAYNPAVDHDAAKSREMIAGRQYT